MTDRQLMIEYNERKSEALLRELEMQNKNISDELIPVLDNLYERLVPSEVKEKVNAMIKHDMEEESKRSIFRFTSSYDEDYCFVPESPINFHTAVQAYCDGMRDDVGHCTLDSLGEYFNARQDIDNFTFSVLCGAMQHDHRIASVFNFNFEDNTIEIIDNHGNNNRIYYLDDIYTAYTNAVENAGGRLTDWINHFDSYIAGKEIDNDYKTEAPTMQM